VGAQTKEREALQDERVQLKVQIKMLKAQLAEMDSARSAASSMGQRRGRFLRPLAHAFAQLSIAALSPP
jgi:hypothetical protein